MSSDAIVILKAGRSAIAARNAVSHTGSLVGDDRVIDAALRQSGAIRVRSLEELIVTAGVMAKAGPLRTGGIAVVSISDIDGCRLVKAITSVQSTAFKFVDAWRR